MAKKPTGSKGGGGEPADAKAAAPRLGPGARIVLLKGADAFLRMGYTEQLKASLVKAGLEVEVFRYDGASAAMADVLDECRSFGLLAAHKLVVVDNADELVKAAGEEEEEAEPAPKPVKGSKGAKGEPARRVRAAPTRRQLLERYAESPCDHATLVLRAATWRKGNLDGMIEKVGVVQECAPLSPDRAKLWSVQRALKHHKRTLEPRAAEQLVNAVGPELARLDSELGKLAAATGENEAITPGHVERLVAPAPIEQSPWVLSDALLSASPEPGLMKLRELIEENRYDPVPLRWACTDLAVKIHSVAAEIAAGVPVQATGKSLKLWGPQQEAVRRAARALGPEAGRRLVEACVTADWKAKTGQSDPVRGLEALVMRFAEELRLSAAERTGR
ncbi:MAG: DNA polymerase III subunit delta [Planctomycetota bacterium]|nr:DNA polymerase III subunit delta [Planctomycetota bacterium]